MNIVITICSHSFSQLKTNVGSPHLPPHAPHHAPHHMSHHGPSTSSLPPSGKRHQHTNSTSSSIDSRDAQSTTSGSSVMSEPESLQDKRQYVNNSYYI
mgnify:CR=1 FL=1